MRVTIPVAITDSEFTSSTAAEPHAPSAYAAGTTYGYGAIVSVAADFAIYESLQASNTGNTPSTSPLWWVKIGVLETAYNAGTTYGLGDTCSSSTYHRCYESRAAGNLGNPLPVPPETETTKWIDVGPTNKWACVDFSRNTQTVSASPLTIVLTPGERINTVGVAGIVGDSITISATSVFGGGSVYSYTEDLTTRQVLDHYMYAFEPFSTAVSTVVFNVPPYSDIIVTVSISRNSGAVRCGGIVLGTYIYIGDTEYAAESDVINFSTIDRDIYGTATLTPRRNVPKTEQTLWLAKTRVDKVYAARNALNAVPALWTGIDDATHGYFGMLLILGVYKRFVINATYPNDAKISLELEEI